jgi:hypothetical protein
VNAQNDKVEKNIYSREVSRAQRFEESTNEISEKMEVHW